MFYLLQTTQPTTDPFGVIYFWAAAVTLVGGAVVALAIKGMNAYADIKVRLAGLEHTTNDNKERLNGQSERIYEAAKAMPPTPVVLPVVVPDATTGAGTTFADGAVVKRPHVNPLDER